MICDVHAQYIPQNFSDFMGERFPPRVGQAVPSGIAKHPVSDPPQDKAAFTCTFEAFGADHLVTRSDYPVLQDYESYTDTSAYISRLGVPAADLEKDPPQERPGALRLPELSRGQLQAG